MRARHRVRRVVNVVTLATPLGLVVGAVSGARFERGPDGLVLGRDARGRFPAAAAFTVGDVVLVRPGVALTDDLLDHEARHAGQWACCLVLFLPLYLLAAGWSWVRTGDHWSRNVFERRAGLTAGGYVESPLRGRRRDQPG